MEPRHRPDWHVHFHRPHKRPSLTNGEGLPHLHDSWPPSGTPEICGYFAKKQVLLEYSYRGPTMAFIIPLNPPKSPLGVPSGILIFEKLRIGDSTQAVRNILWDSRHHCSESFTFFAGLLLSILRIFSPWSGAPKPAKDWRRPHIDGWPKHVERAVCCGLYWRSVWFHETLCLIFVRTQYAASAMMGD